MKKINHWRTERKTRKEHSLKRQYQKWLTIPILLSPYKRNIHRGIQKG